MAEELAFMCKA